VTAVSGTAKNAFYRGDKGLSPSTGRGKLMFGSPAYAKMLRRDTRGRSASIKQLNSFAISDCAII